MITDTLAILCAGGFAGAAIYITAVQHPAMVSCGAQVAVTVFRPMYRRAAKMQAALALIGMLAGVGTWAFRGGVVWLVGGLILGSVIPLTLFVIMPINTRLLDTELDITSAEADGLLAQWAKLHAIRSVAGGVAFIVFVIASTTT